ncbi:MAG: hypothetical protein ABI947_17370 [Chloroflexota bacterium]
MNRRTTTEKAVKAVNYPDVLGVITNGKHLNLDVLQIAVATRPAAINAGKPFDALLFLQNASGGDVDAVLRLIVPEADSVGHKGRFSSKFTKPIRIGLRSGEVGCANLPILSTAQTTPGSGYTLQLDVQVESQQRGVPRVRDLSGGTIFDLEDLANERQQAIQGLMGFNYSIETVGKTSATKATFAAPFEILPAAISGLPQDLKPSYISLWTPADHPDDAALAEKAKSFTAVILPQLKRSNVFFPLLKATQLHFEQAGFRLWAGEAIAITKLLTLVLETGIPPTAAGTQPVYPRWFAKLCRLVIRDPQATSQLDRLVSASLYSELITDASVLGFTMLTTITNEQFGTAEEMNAYAKDLVTMLNGKGDPIDLTHAYLPLVLAGIGCNGRIVMPREEESDTVTLIANAYKKRALEMDEGNKFIFDMADILIARAQEKNQIMLD